MCGLCAYNKPFGSKWVESYLEATASFETLIDFLRFGLSQANKASLYYGHGTDNAWDDVLALVLGSLSLPHTMNPMLLNAKLTSDEKKHLTRQLERRMLEHVPVPYLTHEAYFFDLLFYVDERVLIPRSPLSEWIARQFSPFIEAHQVERVLDLGTGSGCIAIACCHAFPDAVVDAVDVSREALEVAQMNRVKHGVESQLHLLQSDCFDALPEAAYDLIISNPPYVGSDEMNTLPKEYQHEPELALYADNNGLAVVEKMLASAAKYLSKHGILVMEVGNSEDALVAAYPDMPFTWLEFESGGTGVFLLTAEQLKAYKTF
ncbi:MAG: 50S ribosomal protein L3 N(5)-glutamine methyltransferase [Gammaproteobacteria bacterium]|nr:50S ribosomal protein L3 N(5)-glutamine methyltransferase [Gammaproteobacteria bacterium]MCH9763645.1 50S ribosomal protein L3 N(5)-glutamine methyltransferase [Gammaproteobacteria bacterium]